MLKPMRSTALLVIIALIASLFAVAPPARAAGLSDIAAHWAKDAITALVDADVATGYPDNTYRPQQSVTRAEFVALLNRAAGLTSSAYRGGFRDIRATDWCSGYVAAAVNAGYIHGYSDGTFGPNRNITRNEVAVTLARALSLSADGTPPFADGAATPDWAAGSVNAVAINGYMSGYDDGTFSGSRSLTRAEAAMIVYRTRTALVAHLANANTIVTLTGLGQGSIGVPQTYELTYNNSGPAITEKLSLELTVVANDAIKADDLTVQPLTADGALGNPLDFVPVEGATDRMVARLSPADGITVGQGAAVTNQLAITFSTPGAYHLVARLVGASSHKSYGIPGLIGVEVSNLVISISGVPWEKMTNRDIDCTISFRNAGSEPLPEPFRVILVAQTQTSRIGSGGVTFRRQTGNPDAYTSLNSQVSADGQTIWAPLSTEAGVSLSPGETYIVNARISFSQTGTFAVGALAIGMESGKGVGAPGISMVTATPYAVPSLGVYTYTSQLANGQPGILHVRVYNSGSAPAPEKVKIELGASSETEGAVLQPGDITLEEKDENGEYHTIPAGQDGKGLTWDFIPDGVVIPANSTQEYDLRITAREGSYHALARVSGLTTGTYYASAGSYLYSRAVSTAIIGPQTGQNGQTFEYAFEIQNRTVSELSEPLRLTWWFKQVGNPYDNMALSRDSITAEYLEQDGSWKPITTYFSYKTVTGHLNMIDGIQLDSNGHAVVRLRLTIRAEGTFSLTAQLNGISTNTIVSCTDDLPLTIDAPAQP